MDGYLLLAVEGSGNSHPLRLCATLDKAEEAAHTAEFDAAFWGEPPSQDYNLGGWENLSFRIVQFRDGYPVRRYEVVQGTSGAKARELVAVAPWPGPASR